MIDTAVKEAKDSIDWRTEYMTMQMKLQETFDSGVDFGIKATKIATILSLHELNMPVNTIAKVVKMDKSEVAEIINNPESEVEN